MATHRKEETVRILKEAESTCNIREVIRKCNISKQRFYRWHQKYGGMEASEARRLKTQERENTELKKVVAELTLQPHAEGH